MQKKSGYLSVKAMTRKDRVRIIGGQDFTVDPYTQEGATFLGYGTGISQVYLPEAKAGRKFTFITSPDVNIAAYHQIELNPFGGIYSSDRIYDPNAGAFLLAGFSIWNTEAAVSRKIVLECHNDGFWSVMQTIGTWEQPDRSFEVVVTHPDGYADGYIGMTGDPRLQADLYVKNDKFVIAGATTVEDQVSADEDDLALMTMENLAATADEVDIINANHIRWFMGGDDEVIGLDDGVDLQLSQGIAEITIAAAGMVSASAVETNELDAPIYGIEGDLSGANGVALGSLAIEAHNDTWRSDIATESIYDDLIKLTGDHDIPAIKITSVTRTSDTIITIATDGDVDHDTGVGGISIKAAAFNGTIKDSGITQELEGVVTA